MASVRLGRLTYQVDRCVDGGMGRVFLLSRDERAPPVEHPRVAAKTFLPLMSEKDIATELRRWYALRHPAVLPLLEIKWLDWRISAVMPRMTGSLADVIRKGPLPEGTVRHIVQRVLDALAYAARDFGLFHLDLKPHNLLFDSDPSEVRVADWGLAMLTKPTPDGTPRGAVVHGHVGTPLYMAPEQWNQPAWTLDARIDIYSLGVTAIELARGPLNQQGLQSGQSLNPQLRRLAIGLRDGQLRRFVEAAIEIDPKRRPPNFVTAADMLDGGMLERVFGWGPGEGNS